MRHTVHIESGGAITLEEGRPHQIVCCVCGLTHEFQFRITNKKEIVLLVWQNEAQTERELKKVLKRLRQEGLPERKA